MATFQLPRPGFSPALRLRGACPPRTRPSALTLRYRLREGGGGGESNGEERPESLFMKELKRRGLNPTSLLEEGDAGVSIGSTASEGESSGDGDGNRGRSKKRKDVASAELGEGVLNQREVSMSLNSEGLEGLLPRAKLLLTIGGTFFLGFWPLILITSALFVALYILLGPSFVHDASKMPVSPPPQIDPYALLEDDRLSQMTPNLN